MSVRKQVLAVALTCAHVCACSDNPSQPPPAPTAVELTVSDMSPLSVDSLYELWAVQGVEYTSLGKFNVLFSQQIVDSQGTFLSRFSSTGDLSAATRLAVTIETHPDPAPATPTTLEIMTANITGDTLTLGFTKDYSQRTGTLVMITPSDG
ncbi:MAG: anti-sigma factor, partial [Candidatus Zixiibacteriota bacterium]